MNFKQVFFRWALLGLLFLVILIHPINFFTILKNFFTKTATQRSSLKELNLKNSQNLQENICSLIVSDKFARCRTPRNGCFCYSKQLHAFFISNVFFFNSLTFSWIELQMLLRRCLIHINIIIPRHFLYLLYLCPHLDVGLFMSYLCDPFFTIFIFTDILLLLLRKCIF